MNARLERLSLKVQQQFREMMDEGELPAGADLRMILRPLCAQKLLNIGKPEKDLQGYNYARSYSQVVQAIEDFRPGVRPRDLTEKFWEEYLGYLYEDLEVSDGTVGTHIKGWKILRQEAGLSTDEAWLKNTYAKSGVKPDLTWKEIMQLSNHNFKNESHRAAAHIFVINCFLGLRFQDLYSLQFVHLQRIETPAYGVVTTIQRRQGKNGRLVLVPVPPLAQQLLDRGQKRKIIERFIRCYGHMRSLL